MSYKEAIRKYGADKIFLLALFAMSLLLALWLVSSRKSVVLGKAVSLGETGVSVRMPDGHGWIPNENWQQSEDALVLNSIYQPGSGSALIDANCAYRLTSARQSGRQWLANFGGDSNDIEYGNIQTENGQFEWANIKSGGQEQAGTLAATMPLENGRWLDLEILYVGWKEHLAKEALDKITSGITIEKNDLLDKGIAVIKKIKAQGLEKLIEETNVPQCFIITDEKNRDAGYSITAVTKSQTGDETEIRSTSYAELTNPFNLETASMFKGYSDLRKFLWESRFEQRKAVLLKRGNLVIQGPAELFRTNNALIYEGDKLSANRLHGNETTQFETPLSESAVPGAVADALYIEMFNSGEEKIIVDVVFENGNIVPAVITVQKDRQDGYIALFRYLGSNNEEEIYLDGDKQVTKRIVRQNVVLTLEPVDADELIRRFPQRADFILQRIATMQQGKL